VPKKRIKRGNTSNFVPGYIYFKTALSNFWTHEPGTKVSLDLSIYPSVLCDLSTQLPWGKYTGVCVIFIFICLHESWNKGDIRLLPLSVWMHSGTLCTSINLFTNVSSIVLASRSGNGMATKYLENLSNIVRMCSC